MNETVGCNGATGAEKRSFPMTTKHIAMAAAALLATTLGVSIARAQSDQASSPKAPMNQGVDHRGMMDMSKMNRMMDNCNRMMESEQQHSPSGPQTTTPDKG
jgi:negative regulator of sigma E activity